MSTIELLSIIKDFTISCAAIVTAYVAYTGLEKWQKELRGKANFEVARALIKSVYKLRDEIGYCRSPFISAHEFPDGYMGVRGNHSNEEEGEAWAHVYTKRWEPVGKTIQEFDAAVLEAAGERVHFFPGDQYNIKITRPGDLELAEALAR